MSHRTFVNTAGQEWHAFDVVPVDHERRHLERRSGEVVFDDTVDRRDQDRRVTVGGRSERMAGASWLCFEYGDECRRLSPIPDDWRRCSDEQLAAYCVSARPVRRSVRMARPETSPKPEMRSAAD